jgi:molecular chaperone DnaK
MMREAESHSEADKTRKEAIETRNQADQSVYTAERMLKDAGDKLEASDREPIESAIVDLKKTLESDDSAAITAAIERLTAAQHKAAEAMYKQTSDTPPPEDPGPAASPPSGGDAAADGATEGEVIDAEVVEEKT